MAEVPSVPLIDYDADPDLAPRSFRFKWQGVTYHVTEASEDTAVKVRNEGLRNTKLQNGKVVGLDKAADVEPMLVALCTQKVIVMAGGKEKLEPVSPLVVRTWSAKLVKRVYAKVQEISELAEQVTESDLLKQIEVLEERLKSIRETKQVTDAPAEEDGSQAKNEQGSGQPTSQ